MEQKTQEKDKSLEDERGKREEKEKEKEEEEHGRLTDKSWSSVVSEKPLNDSKLPVEPTDKYKNDVDSDWTDEARCKHRGFTHHVHTYLYRNTGEKFPFMLDKMEEDGSLLHFLPLYLVAALGQLIAPDNWKLTSDERQRREKNRQEIRRYWQQKKQQRLERVLDKNGDEDNTAISTNKGSAKKEQ